MLTAIIAATDNGIVTALIAGGVVGALVSLVKWRTEKVGVEATASKVATDTAVEIIGALREENSRLRKEQSDLRLDYEISIDQISACHKRIDELEEREDWHERRVRQLERALRAHDVPVPSREHHE